MRQQPTWNDQIVGGYASYWVYQHLGNLSPEELNRNDLYNEVKEAEDAWPVLREFAYRTHRVPDGTRWSYHRDLGNTRLLMIDSRGGRVLDEGRRSMVDAEEWAWISDRATGGFDHLLIGTSLPLLLGPGMHHLQSWDERLCSGAWGKRAARWAEGFRRSQDLDHWASFHDSFAAMVDLSRRHSKRREGRFSLDRPDPLRRRPPRIPRRSHARQQREEPHLPGCLLPPPQRPSGQEVLSPRPRLDETGVPRYPPPGPPCGCYCRAPLLAPDPRRRLLRQPDRHPGARKPERYHHLREGRPRRERNPPWRSSTNTVCRSESWWAVISGHSSATVRRTVRNGWLLSGASW